jgi:2-amino-4-hydroxy-6-hydroxymethyldihydropteridine diphosphokinase
MNQFFLSLGTNKGENLEDNLNKCIAYLLKYKKNIKLLKLSSNYSTEPVDMNTKNWFLNKVILIETNYNANELLKITQAIETKMGRHKNITADDFSKKYFDREIDIDILSLSSDNKILNTSELIIPHPKMHERLFVLLPLQEISPNWIHPVLKQTVFELLKNMHPAYKNLKCTKKS